MPRHSRSFDAYTKEISQVLLKLLELLRRLDADEVCRLHGEYDRWDSLFSPGKVYLLAELCSGRCLCHGIHLRVFA